MNVSINDPRIQSLEIKQPFFSKWIVRLAAVLVGLLLLTAALWSLYKVFDGKFYTPAEGESVTLRTWIYTGFAVLGLLLGLWCLISPWRQSGVSLRAESDGLHVTRGSKSVRKIGWKEIDSISSRPGYGHGAIIWMNDMKRKVSLPFVRRKALVSLIETWKRYS